MRGRLAYPRPARRGAQSNAAWAAAGTVKGVGRRLPSQYQDAETGLHYTSTATTTRTGANTSHPTLWELWEWKFQSTARERYCLQRLQVLSSI